MNHDYKKAQTAFENFRNLQNALVQEMDVDAAIHALEIARKLQEGEYVLCEKLVHVASTDNGTSYEYYKPITAAQETRKG